MKKLYIGLIIGFVLIVYLLFFAPSASNSFSSIEDAINNDNFEFAYAKIEIFKSEFPSSWGEYEPKIQSFLIDAAQRFHLNKNHDYEKDLLAKAYSYNPSSQYGSIALDKRNNHKIRYRVFIISAELGDYDYDPDFAGRAPDGFITISLDGHQIYKTNVIRENYSPHWEEQFEYNMPDNVQIMITVFDSDLFDDDQIGRYSGIPQNFINGTSSWGSNGAVSSLNVSFREIN